MIDLTDVFTYTGSVYLGESEVSGTSLKTLFSNGSLMYSRLLVKADHKMANGKYTNDIVKRFFSVQSLPGNVQPQNYEVILTLLDQEGREAGPQYQVRFESDRPGMVFCVHEPAVTRICGDSGHLRYRVEIRSLEKKLANASDTDAEIKMVSKPVPPNSIHLEKPAKIIAKLLNNDDLYSDVVVACGEGLRMKAHKAILCAHSETFRLAFSQKNLVEGRNGVYTISEDHMRPKVVRLLLEWMYLQAGLEKPVFF